VIWHKGKQTIKFTDGVRLVLKQNRNAILTATDIRTCLLNLGFDFAKYSQPMTPIHNCLKRLEEQGEVMAKKTKDGQVIGYTWISSIERALAEDTFVDVSEQLRLDAQLDARRAVEETTRAMEANRQTVIKEIETMQKHLVKRIKKG
jgi:hypothetical protein